MNILYVDCKYGISGDMMLSSLVDLGADQEYIITELKKLPIDDFEIQFETVNKLGISSKRLKISFSNHEHEHSHNDSHSHTHHSYKHKHSNVHTHTHTHNDEIHTSDHHKHNGHRNAQQILSMITESKLPERVKFNSFSLFEEVARAEGKIHGVSPEKVHFHEVGAMDSIIDTIGVCLAIESLGVEKIVFSPVPTGFGLIKIAHGLYPVPAPATAEILVGVPLSDFTYEAELTTPTGASFAKILATEYFDSPTGEIIKIGYGSGTKEFSHPNILRTMLLKKKHQKN